MKIKGERIASFLMKEINDILFNKVRDKGILGTSVTSVSLSSDYEYAKVYCINLDDNKDSIKELNKSKGFIKSELYKRKLPLRVLPELEFIYDESIEYAKKIEDKIKEINDVKR